MTADKGSEDSDMAHILNHDKDSSFEAISADGSLEQVIEENDGGAYLHADPIAHYDLHKFSKFISAEDRELLKAAMYGAKTCSLTYPPARYHEDHSPMCIYIPSNQVLFKMMRAAIGVSRAEDTWIY